MNRLVTFGDSWTAGHGVETDIQYKEEISPNLFIDYLRLMNGWPKYLANKLDIPFVNLAFCNKSNNQIYEDIIKWKPLLNKDDLIIVMLSYPYRKYGNPIIDVANIVNELSGYNYFILNSFYPTFSNIDPLDIHHINLTKFLNIDGCVSDVLIKWEQENKQSCWEYGFRKVNNSNTFLGGDYHPNTIGYKLIAEDIYKQIKRFNAYRLLTIPIAAPVELFRFQTSLFEFFQKKVYGDDAYMNSIIIMLDRNKHNSSHKNLPWNIDLRYKLLPGIHKELDESKTHSHYNSINVFYPLKYMIDTLPDEKILCVIDCDVVPLKVYDGIIPNDDEVITCDIYENWHMHIKDPSKENFYKIEPFLEHTDYEYMDGGFVPIIINVKTLKKILNDVINISERVIDSLDDDDRFGWWGTMAGFQIACHNHKIKCISQDNTYVPHINNLDTTNHYFAHYSCDPKFAKKDYPKWDMNLFDNNKFYNTIKVWSNDFK